ncbi:PREDICTED: uncharacterized protein LOC104610612 [Nelumbo nucifera]|uniref:Uncharacterized protein LOC104610612 n=1 Tax=Nelumbo nucifera TaxID=4432 RepID=A0A1U8B471_NELNU|nr:PREDICTED: uncharacterized protein LOC104610612 [Nelumbo nucifera]
MECAVNELSYRSTCTFMPPPLPKCFTLQFSTCLVFEIFLFKVESCLNLCIKISQFSLLHRGDSTSCRTESIICIFCGQDCESAPIVLISHQVELRALYAYFADRTVKEIPHIKYEKLLRFTENLKKFVRSILFYGNANSELHETA